MSKKQEKQLTACSSLKKKRKYKILILIIHHSSAWGGGTLSCFDIAQMLLGRHDFKLALANGDNPVKNYAKSNGYDVMEESPLPTVFRYYSGGPNFFKVLGTYLKTLKGKKEWRDYLSGSRPEAVFLNSIVLWPMLSVFREKGIKTVLFVRETKKQDGFPLVNKMIKSALNRYADAVIFLSAFDRDEWSLRKEVKQLILPDVVDIESFENRAQKLDLPIFFESYEECDFPILFAGGISELKGTLTAINAMRYLNEKARLFVIGDCDTSIVSSGVFRRVIQRKKYRYTRRVMETLDDPKLKDKVCLVGVVEDASSWYKSCKLCLIPIMKPHQSRSIFEMGVFSHPVVATDFEIYGEYLVHGENGLVFPRGNSKALAEAINQLMSDNKFYFSLGTHNREYAERFHSHCVNRDRLCDFLDGFL